MLTGHPETRVSPCCERRCSNRAHLAAATIITAMGAGLLLASPVSADPAPNLTAAVAAVRAGANCGPLQYDPMVEHAAEIVNRSTDDYINQTARNVPVSDPLPVVKDVGATGGKARSLQGAGNNDGDAIKGLLLEGYAAIPDCSYTSFGASMLWNAGAGKSIAVVVLVGP